MISCSLRPFKVLDTVVLARDRTFGELVVLGANLRLGYIHTVRHCKDAKDTPSDMPGMSFPHFIYPRAQAIRQFLEVIHPHLNRHRESAVAGAFILSG
jgi:hypothetical protein